MEIKFLGHSAFRIKGKEATIITDPFDPKMVGIKWSNQEADILLISHDHQDHNYIEGVSGEPFVIRYSGEYEVKGVRVYGIQAFHDNKKGAERGLTNLYVIEIDGFQIAHLGDLGCALTSDQVEELNTVDIVMIPVGGKYTIDAEIASEVLAQLEPSIVIPMHYKEAGLKDVASVDKFLEQMGQEKVRREEKLKLKSRSELPEETEVVVLAAKQ